MKKTIDIKKLFIVALMAICVVTLGIVCIHDVEVVNIANATSSEEATTEELCKLYTDDDMVYGTGYTIRMYPTDLLANNIDNNVDIRPQVYGDDPIVNIIPRQYFVERGEHFYIGNEYGFFVSTREIEANHTNNLIVALVFDISSGTDLDQTKNTVVLEVNHIFQYYYAYLTQTDDYYIIPGFGGAPVYCDGVSAQGNVIPVVHGDNQVMESDEYFLKDIRFGLTLYNEQELNTINNGYNAHSDDGSFIIGQDYSCNGVELINVEGEKDKKIFSDLTELGLRGLDIVLGIISKTDVFPINHIAGALNKFQHAVADFDMICNLINDINSPTVVTTVKETTFHAKCMYTTRRDQLAHYTDERECKPTLVKSSMMYVNGEDSNIWYGNGNFATGYFTVADSASTPWYTRCIQEFALNIVDKDGNVHVAQALGSRTVMLHDPIYKPGYVGSNEFAFLPQGKQYVSFRPQFTGDYEITFDKPYEFNVAVVDTQTNQRTVVTPVDGKYKHRFVGGRTYKVEIYSPYGDVINTTFEPADNTMSQSFDANGKNVFKYENTKDQVVVLTSSNSNVKLIGVYQQNENGSLTSVPEIASLKACTKADMYMQAGKTYYVVLENTSSEKTSASVQIEAKTDAEFVNNMAIHFDNSANYKYFSFTPSQNGDYYITFENNESSQALDYTLNYYCFDQNRREIVFTGLDIGYLILNGLESGNTYYIAISSTNETTVISNIKREEAKFTWKMKVNGIFEEIESTVYLKRGNTYEFGLWVDDVKARNYKCYIKEQVKGYFKTDSTKSSVVTILNNATDMMDITITAVIDAPEIGLYPNQLLIYAVYDESKVNVDINYVNTTEVVLNDQNGAKEIKAWTGTIYLDSETIKVDNETNIYKEILIERKVWHWFRFTLNSITISSLYNDKTIDGLSISRTVYTMYSNTSIENGKTVYHISNGLQFYNIRKDLRYKRVLENDISLKNFQNWTAISSLTCDIDGKGHAITNLKIVISAPYVYSRYGLVEANRATISNLTLADFNMSFGWEEKSNWMYVGSFAGVNYGTIQNCQAYGSIYGYREYMSVGGITGQNNGNIIGTTYGRPVGTGVASVAYSWGELGGIAGQNYGLIQHTRVLNTKIQHRVYGSARSIGGIAGYAENCEIANCAVEDSVIENINDQEIKSFCPKMGIIFGHMVNGTITSVGARNVSTSTGKLGKDNKKYCFNGGWGFLGLMENCVVDGNVGQYAP